MLLVMILFIFLFSLTNTSVIASDYQDLMVQHMNAERQRLGKSQIVLDSGLSNLAAVRSKEIAISFSHQRPNNSAWHTVFQEQGLTTGYAGENIAKKSFVTDVSSSELADVFYSLWKNSPGHYQNMIKEEHRYLGLSLYKEGNIYHMVQIFNSEPSSGSRPTPQEETKSQAKPTPKEETKDQAKPSSPKKESQKPSSSKEQASADKSKDVEEKKAVRQKARVEIVKDEKKKDEDNKKTNTEKRTEEKKIVEEDKNLAILKKEKEKLDKDLQKIKKEHQDLKLQYEHLNQEQKDCEDKSRTLISLLVFSSILNFMFLILLLFRKKRPKTK